MERKSQLKTIKVRLFSFSFKLPLFFTSVRNCVVKRRAWCWEWHLPPQLLRGLAGVGVTACHTLPPVTSSVCLGPVTLQEVETGSDWWSHRKRKMNESWVHNFWPADRYDGMIFVTTEGYNGLQPPHPTPHPLPLKVLKPSVMEYVVLHLHLLYSVSFDPVSFLNVSFTAFLSPWHDGSLTFFAFLFCCGLDSTCFVFEVMSSVSLSWVWAPFQSSVLIWWSLFSLRVYCY